jgi:tetratricopeptide (TPR) repeat protein
LLAPAVPPAVRAAGLRGALGLPAAATVLILALLLTPPYHRARTAQWLGDDLASQGDAAGAAAAFARAAALQPDDPQFELSQAQALARLGDPAALPHVRRAIAIDPRSAAARAELARWCAQHGDPAGALGNLDEALRLYPSHVGYRLERAELHLRQGNRAAARADVDYILGHKLLVWEFEQPRLDQLKATLGLS